MKERTKKVEKLSKKVLTSERSYDIIAKLFEEQVEKDQRTFEKKI